MLIIKFFRKKISIFVNICKLLLLLNPIIYANVTKVLKRRRLKKKIIKKTLIYHNLAINSYFLIHKIFKMKVLVQLIVDNRKIRKM